MISFAYSPVVPESTNGIMIFIKVIKIIIISIVFGRLVDIVSIWARILRIALFFILLSSISSLYSITSYDILFYVTHILKITCYTTMMVAITYLWVRITTYNGNTLKQIIGVYYGTGKNRNTI
jgi:hypothetical protein